MRQYKTELSIIFILLFIWEAEFFILDILPHFKAQAAEPPPTPQVVINEIAWMGTDTSPNDEWIELLNNSDEDINLNGWILRAEDNTPTIGLSGTIPKKAYFLLERTDDNTITDINADLTYGTDHWKWALNNEGEKLVLQDDKGNIINQIDKWFAGKTNPRITMERISPLGEPNDRDNWADNNQIIFNGEDAAGKPIFGTPKQKNSVSYPKEEPSAPPENPEDTPNPIVPNVIINELLPNPSSSQEGEFIELKNLSDFEGILEGWKIGDKQKNYSFTTETVPAQGFFVLPHSKSKIFLNNDGDAVYLYNNNQILQDSITYSGKIPQGESYNRQDDNTWAWSTTTTPDLQNIITTKDDPANAMPNKSYPRHIWINEFFPNPAGRDTENEFIEIYNKGPDEIDLNGWQIDDCENKGSRPHKFPAGKIIKAGEYLSLPYSDTKIALNNDQDCVRLLWPDDTAIDEIEYENPPEAESYNKKGQGWCWNTTPTPGEQNNCSGKKPEKEEMKDYSRALWINEFLPDSKGKDEEGEFIELQNRGEEEIDLTSWRIDDCENTGSRPHTFPENTKIKANSYLVLYYKETKISLNNNGDCVRLLNPAGQAVDEIKYGKAKEGQSYSRQNVDHWQWIDNPTPYKDNEFTQILAAKNSITKNNQPPAITPKRQILPQTGPNIYIYFSPVFLFFFIFYLTKIKKYYKNRNCSFIKST